MDRRTFSREYKLAAVRRVVEQGLSFREVARELWKKDLIKEFRVFPRASVMNFHHWSSVAIYKNWMYVVTGNGVSGDYRTVPEPDAPNLICFDKLTGKVVWKDSSPGGNILLGQWSSPLVVEVNGRTQAIVAQGDGWVRSFDATSGEPIWQFDMNRKSWRFTDAHRGKRNYLLATPVFHDNRVYVASGHHFRRESSTTYCRHSRRRWLDRTAADGKAEHMTAIHDD